MSVQQPRTLAHFNRALDFEVRGGCQALVHATGHQCHIDPDFFRHAAAIPARPRLRRSSPRRLEHEIPSGDASLLRGAIFEHLRRGMTRAPSLRTQPPSGDQRRVTCHLSAHRSPFVFGAMEPVDFRRNGAAAQSLLPGQLLVGVSHDRFDPRRSLARCDRAVELRPGRVIESFRLFTGQEFQAIELLGLLMAKLAHEAHHRLVAGGEAVKPCWSTKP